MLTFLSSQTLGKKWSMSTQTSQCVCLWKSSPINSKTCTRFTCIFHYVSFRLVQLPWTNPLYPLLWGSPFFSKCWVMFGQSVCWSCTLGPHIALLKGRGLPGWAAESDHWPGPQAPKYRRHKAHLVTAVVRWKWTRHVALWRATLQPGSLRPQTRVNKHNQLHKHFRLGLGKPTKQLATKEGRLSIEGLLGPVLRHCFDRELFLGPFREEQELLFTQ